MVLVYPACGRSQRDLDTRKQTLPGHRGWGQYSVRLGGNVRGDGNKWPVEDFLAIAGSGGCLHPTSPQCAPSWIKPKRLRGPSMTLAFAR